MFQTLSSMVPNSFVKLIWPLPVTVYTRPVLMQGSTTVKTSFTAIVTVCSDGGYLNEFAGLEGCNSISLTWLSFDFRWRTQANHHSLSIKHVTNPAIDSGGISSSETVTLSSLQEVAAENCFTWSLSFEIGINEWSLRVPGMVWALRNRCSRSFFFLLHNHQSYNS